jgi:hypothetical protein
MSVVRICFLICIYLLYPATVMALPSEPNTVICNTCGLVTPSPDGTSTDTTTTLGLLSNLSGGIDYPPGTTSPYTRRISVCKIESPLENSRCVIYKRADYRTDPWTGHVGPVTYQFCAYLYSTQNQWLDSCDSLWGEPPGHNGDPPSSPIGPCVQEPGGVYYCEQAG